MCETRKLSDNHLDRAPRITFYIWYGCWWECHSGLLFSAIVFHFSCIFGVVCSHFITLTNRRCSLKLLEYQWWKIAWKATIVVCLPMAKYVAQLHGLRSQISIFMSEMLKRFELYTGFIFRNSTSLFVDWKWKNTHHAWRYWRRHPKT